MEILEEKIYKNDRIISKWFYVYKDSLQKKHKRVCKNCSTKEQAEAYISKLDFVNQYLIKNIAKDMYLPESEHLNRLRSFGKNISHKTRIQKRQIIELIIKQWGEYSIKKLRVADIEKYLLDNHQHHSGSWKNFYLETFGNIYDETIWKCEFPVSKPCFQKFARNSKKCDVFTTEELNKIFQVELWDNYQDYLVFYLAATCGLRLGEARALKVNQINLKNQYLIVNGFCKNDGFRTDYNKTGNEEDKKHRVVPLPDEALIKVANYIAMNKLDSDDFLFSHLGKPITQDHLYKTFIKKVKLLKLNPLGNRKLVPHSLRFTYVTRMRRNLPAEDVRELVGHSSLKMTEYYTRPSLPELQYLIDKTKDASNNLFNK